jgi:hypothetical protein
MQPNTIIQLPDGREGTVVYHHLDGYGIVWGQQGPFNEDNLPAPEAMLREPYPSASLPCVGKHYVILEADPA